MSKEIKHTIVILAGLFCASLMLQSCGRNAQPEGSNSPKSISSEKTQDTVLVVKAQFSQLRNKIVVPGELLAYQDVPIHAKVEGFISWIGVDRGSWVKKGQKMMTIYCPELLEKIDEASAKLSAAQAVVTRARSTLQNEKAQLLEEQAKLDADQLTYTRLVEAARTPGAIAQNDVDIAEKTVEGDRGRVQAGNAAISAAEAVIVAEQRNVLAAQRVVDSLKAMRSYLTIEAPFDGVISSRNVHQGSIVAVDAARTASPLVRILQVSLLRLVAAIPEDAVGSLHEGDKIPFTVPAYPGRMFEGTVVRPAFAIDPSTRTMPVELNVPNVPRVLDPGMFCNVEWTVSRAYKTAFLPGSAVGTDLVGSFVNKVVDGLVKRVPVKKGDTMGDLIEIIGDVKEGDEFLLKATNELKDGSRITVELASTDQVKQANSKGERAAGE